MLASVLWILMMGFFVGQLARRLGAPPLIGMIIVAMILRDFQKINCPILSDHICSLSPCSLLPAPLPTSAMEYFFNWKSLSPQALNVISPEMLNAADDYSDESRTGARWEQRDFVRSS
ncbi:MAG: hypothetical protein NWQ28_07730 [Nodularia sp. (in: cyanobacteria)]|nr:hypothetical protein [Nodularia sp. (in: cyanobacteria)]